jgi:hypothetical protein
MGRPPYGLCDSCAHQRLVRSGRGSEFSLCRLAASDPRFPKYPRVPVLECAGFEQRGGEPGAQRGDGSGAEAAPRRGDGSGTAIGTD